MGDAIWKTMARGLLRSQGQYSWGHTIISPWSALGRAGPELVPRATSKDKVQLFTRSGGYFSPAPFHLGSWQLSPQKIQSPSFNYSRNQHSLILFIMFYQPINSLLE